MHYLHQDDYRKTEESVLGYMFGVLTLKSHFHQMYTKDLDHSHFRVYPDLAEALLDQSVKSDVLINPQLVGFFNRIKMNPTYARDCIQSLIQWNQEIEAGVLTVKNNLE